MKKYKGGSKGSSNASSKTLKPAYDYSDDDDIYTDDDDFYSDEESPDYYSSAVSGKTGGYFHQFHQSGGNKKQDYYHGTSGSSNKHKNSKEPAYKVNKYQTIVLKVQVHCDACIKKVKKAIAKIEGVESISVDARQKKVSVTGYLDPKKLLKKVAKTGKHVELVGNISSNAMLINGGYPANTNKASMFLPYEHRQNSAVINNNKAYSNAAMANMDLVNKSNTKQHSHHHHHPLPFNSNTDGRMLVMQNPPPYNDVGFIFSDDNVNNCSIM